MQFHVDITGRVADLAAVEAALLRLDPSAVADRDPLQPMLRIETQLGQDDLVRALNDAGCSVRADAVYRMPSTCCGGCGG